METILLFENSTPFCLSESWDRDLIILNDRPLSAAFWKLGEMTGEAYLAELPIFQVNVSELRKACN